MNHKSYRAFMGLITAIGAIIGLMSLIITMASPATTVHAGSHILFSEDFATFTGTGFAASPAAGQLDSNLWRLRGMSDGNTTFGGDYTSGDHARGSSTGGVGTGGTYAFDVGSSIILGVQPGGSDFTPGSFDLRLENDTGATIESLTISYKIWVYNDQGRANSLNFAYSFDDTSYTAVSELDYTTPGAADAPANWFSVDREITLLDFSLAPGDYIYLRWESDDVSGGGARDEFGITDIEVAVVDPPAITLDKSGPIAGVAGEDIVYALTVSNLTTATLTSVTLTDTLPVSTTYVADSSGIMPTNPMGNTYVWELGDLPPTSTTTIYLTATTDVNIAPNTVLTNTAVIDALLDVDSVSDTDAWATTFPAIVTIYDIQEVADPDADDASPLVGETVWTEGVITAVPGEIDGTNTLVIQDAAGGPWSGIVVDGDFTGMTLMRGDHLRVLGTVVESFGFTRLNSQQIEVLGQTAVPAPQILTTADFPEGNAALSEQWEGVLIEFQDALVTQLLGFGEWQFDDGSGIVRADDTGSITYAPTVGDRYEVIRGIGWYSFNNYKLQPRDDDDIELFVPDLNVTKIGPQYGVIGEDVTYSLTLANSGIITATNVVLTDSLPLSTTYVTAVPTPTTILTDTLIWEIGDLDPGLTTTIYLTLSSDSNIPSGTSLTNEATLISDELNDPVLSVAQTILYPLVTIYDIQEVADPESSVTSPLVGQVVWTEGIVTAAPGEIDVDDRILVIQDPAGGPWSGIVVFRGSSLSGLVNDAPEGTHLRLLGEVGEFFSLTQLYLNNPDGAPSAYEVISSGNPLPAPAVVNTGDFTVDNIAQAEQWEGVLIEFQETAVTDPDLGFGEWAFNDGSGNTRADNLGNRNGTLTYVPEEGDYYTFIRGIGWYSFNNYKLQPRYDADIGLLTTRPEIEKSAPITISAGNLFTYTITVQNQIGTNLTDIVVTDTLPAHTTLATVLDGGMLDGDTIVWNAPTLADQTTIDFRFVVTATTDIGTVIINDDYAIIASNYVTPTFGSPVYTFVGDFMPIHQIQGESFLSPYQGVTLPTQGVVVGFFEGNSSLGNFNAFFIQDPDAGGAGTDASDGIMINPGLVNPGVAVGDLVRVTGEVQEYSEWDGANCSTFSTECVTQINTGGTANIEILDTGYTITPTVVNPPLGDAVTAELYWESLEGMLVTMPMTGVVVGPTSFSTIDVIRSDYGLDRVFRNTPYQGTPFGVRHFARFGSMPGGAPNLIAGSVITNVTGPLGYSYGRYIAFTQFDDQWQVVSSAPPPAVEPTWPAATMDEFTVMSFNVENFSSATGSHMAKVVRSIDNVNGPTFIGLQEVRVSTVITTLINQLDSLGYPYAYAYSHPDVGGHGVAVLWRTDRVTDVEWSADFQGCSPYGTTSSTYDPIWEECRAQDEYPLFSRRPVVVTGTVQFEDGDMTVVVIGNHFKSKLGGIPADLRRLGQAELVADLADNFAATTTPYVIVVGDLNDFEDSPPLDALYASGTLTNTWYSLPPDQRYSYIFRGVSQILDHILVTDELLAIMDDVSGIHNSADFPFSPYKTNGNVVWRVSDHDQKMATFTYPGTADLQLSKMVAVSNTPAQPGDIVTYTISLSNDGEATAFNVMLTDTLPNEIIFGDFIMGTNINPDYADGVITWTGDLPANVQNAVIVYTATVAANTYNATVTNTVYVSHTSGSSSDSASFMVAGPPDLAISKAVALGNNPALPGDVVTYTISLNNNGEATAFNVMLTDTLPSEIIFGDFIMGTNIDAVYADGAITWTGDLPANAQNAVIVFTATVNMDVADGSEIVNTVHFTYEEGSGSDSATFTVTVEEEEEMYTLYLPLILKP